MFLGRQTAKNRIFLRCRTAKLRMFEGTKQKRDRQTTVSSPLGSIIRYKAAPPITPTMALATAIIMFSNVFHKDLFISIRF